MPPRAVADPRVLLLHGEESFLVEEEAKRVLDTWRTELTSYVGYEPLDAVTDPEVALADGAPLVHDELGTNRCYRWELDAGDIDKAFADAAVTVSCRFRQNRLIPNAIEPRACLAQPGQPPHQPRETPMRKGSLRRVRTVRPSGAFLPIGTIPLRVRPLHGARFDRHGPRGWVCRSTRSGSRTTRPPRCRSTTRQPP